MLMRIDPKRAPQNPFTWNPLNNAETNQSINPLMTSRNNPKVRRVSGKVRITRMGRMIVFTIPRRRAAIKADKKPSTAISPGRCMR